MVYLTQFHYRYDVLQNDADKRDIRNYAIQIANHLDPENIGGCVQCTDGVSTKLAFNTGWVIIYKKKGSEIHFLSFYKEKVN